MSILQEMVDESEGIEDSPSACETNTAYKLVSLDIPTRCTRDIISYKDPPSFQLGVTFHQHLAG